MRIWPTRDAKRKQYQPIVTDIDAIASQSVLFRMNEKTFEIKPLKLEDLLLFMNEVQKLWIWDVNEHTISAEGVVDRVYDLVSPVVKEIKRKDIEVLNTQQIGALIQTIVDAVKGTAQAESQKKSHFPKLETKLKDLKD